MRVGYREKAWQAPFLLWMTCGAQGRDRTAFGRSTCERSKAVNCKNRQRKMIPVSATAAINLRLYKKKQRREKTSNSPLTFVDVVFVRPDGGLASLIE